MADPSAPQFLSDVQFEALVGVITAVGAVVAAALRWSVKRVVKAIDRNSDSHEKVAGSYVEHAKAMTALTIKIDSVAEWVEEHTPVTDPGRPLARTTAPGGYRPPGRPGTKEG